MIWSGFKDGVPFADTWIWMGLSFSNYIAA